MKTNPNEMSISELIVEVERLKKRVHSLEFPYSPTIEEIDQEESDEIHDSIIEDIRNGEIEN